MYVCMAAYHGFKCTDIPCVSYEALDTALVALMQQIRILTQEER